MSATRPVDYVAFDVVPASKGHAQIFHYTDNEWLSRLGIVWIWNGTSYEVRCPRKDEQKVRELFARYGVIVWRTELELRTHKFVIFKELFGLESFMVKS